MQRVSSQSIQGCAKMGNKIIGGVFKNLILIKDEISMIWIIDARQKNYMASTSLLLYPEDGIFGNL